ncbi:MAG: PAS domain-containing protein [Lentisphaerae bacterium]|jgi:PAS domain S-box-containing protein|nr:PAS domain-containing protein [Lentisphaerota bacterium]
MKSAFWDKVIGRLDRMDPDSVQTQFARLVSEWGQLKTIFHALREGILVLDMQGRVVFANRAAGRLLGMDETAVVGQPMGRWLPEVDWTKLDEFEGQEWNHMAAREIEISYPAHRFLEMYLAPLQPVQQDAPSGVVMILRDVSRERDLTAEIIESERLNAILMLAAGVAHEIGNPLNSLGIHMQLMDRELRSLPEEARAPLEELLGVARSEIDRLDQILAQFLKAIRPSLPNFQYQALPGIVAETLDTQMAEIHDRQVTVEVEPADELPLAWVDRAQARQAFFNIIRNAIQAMTGGGVLTISFVAADQTVGVAFQDTGPGIDSERMGDLFRPFESTKPSGHGMGLMIVQRIMRDHGGTVMVDSEPTGTRIQLSFRRHERRIRLLPAPAEAEVGETAE